MRRVYATFGSLAFVLALAVGAQAQGDPVPSPTPTPSVTAAPMARPAPPATADPRRAPPTASALPSSVAPGSRCGPNPRCSPDSGAGWAAGVNAGHTGALPTDASSPAPDASSGPPGPDATPTPLPSPSPTPVPIIADPPAPSVEPGKVVQIRLSGIYGTIVATSANPQVADVVADQNQRALFITGRTVGTTTITVKDDRAVITRDVPVRVAYARRQRRRPALDPGYR